MKYLLLYVPWGLKRTCSLTIILLLLLSCLAPAVLAQTVSKQDFDNLPWKLFYFQDSEVIMWLDNTAQTVWRSPDLGRTWAKVPNVPENVATQLFEHPFDNNLAYILGAGTTHYKTLDKGATWQSFKTSLPPPQYAAPLSFHSERSNYVLYRGTKCEENGSSTDCHDETFYTIDNFATDPKLLLTYTDTCSWTRSTKEFKASPEKEIMCIDWPNQKTDSVRNPDSSRLVQSENYFESIEPVSFETSLAATGIVGFTGKDKFILAAAKAPGNSDDMSFYVTEDGERWAHAIFPSGSSVHQKAYTILESTHYALFVDVQTNPRVEIGALHISNSNGTFFTLSLPNTNRNADGVVDFEKIQGVEGIMMANIVANPTDVVNGITKQLRTRMSFDDGRKWSSIKHVVQRDGSQFSCNGQEEDCTLHLHSVTQSVKDLYSFGNVLSANGPVGFVMGVGNVGSHLLDYEDCNTFLSIDGGLNWKLVEEGPHKYEFGDMGSVLVLVNDKEATNYVMYSKNRGKDWQKLDLGITVRARLLTSDPESTTAKFLLIGTIVKGVGSDDMARSVQAIHLDFSNIFPRRCEDESSNQDFEKWYARDLTPDADCLMGHEQAFLRRKADAECYVGRKFADPQVEMKNCPCTAQDYECDYNFIEDDQGKCKRTESWRIPDGQCKTKDSTFLSSSGYRKIPGNTCEGGQKLDEPVDLPCSTPENFVQDPSEITPYPKFFDNAIEQFLYFKDSSSILIRTKNGELFRTGDEGVTWTKVLEQYSPILGIWLHEHDNNRGYVFTPDLFFITLDQGATWTETKLPAKPARLSGTPILDSHPTKWDWLIFVGEAFEPTYRTEAFYSQDHGKNWVSFATFVKKCIFGRDANFDGIELESILCSEFKYKTVEDPANPIQMIKTKDWGKSQEVLFSDVVEFFVVENFMAVATQLNGALVLHVSVDGKNFEEARFPPSMNVDRNTFTILQSTTRSILLDVFHSMNYGLEYGTLFKSDESGVYYNPALQYTNGDASGLVDFEKMQGIDGIILANQVMNTEELNGGRDLSKKVRTMISWDDGGKWEQLKAPADSSCETADCKLHLHSRTSIHGPGAIFTASSAPGLAMGVGNVGKYLLPYEQGNTFLTRDAGHTWTQVRAGEHLYEFGDQGTLLILVNDEGPTDELLYSWDQGSSWREFKFSSEKVRVSVLTTEPKSASLKFILIGHTLSSDKQNAQQVVIAVDFSNTQQRPCVLAKSDPDKNDFEKWTPKDDDGDDACLLGRKVVYWRRKKERVCYVGGDLKSGIDTIQEHCECRDIDFECDFGFWRDDKGECALHGRHPDQPATCKDSFLGRSGYRKISKSLCENGIDLTKQKEWPCNDATGVTSTKTVFDAAISESIYFEDTDTVIIRTSDGKVWQSNDDGYSWNPLFGEVEILAIYQNPFFGDRAYFITNGTKHYMTIDKARSTSPMDVTLAPAFDLSPLIMKFHAEEPGWIIYIGEDKCDSIYSQDCHTEAFYSKDGGLSWKPLTTYVRSCLWGCDARFKTKDKDTIFCHQYYEKSGNQRMFGLSNPAQFVSTPDYYLSKKVLFDYIVGVAIFEQYMIVAELVDSGSSLRLSISLNGDIFAEAMFPPAWKLKHEAYTIMESVTSSVWLHVSTSTIPEREYGVIFTSNSNGTYFGLSLENVNRNIQGIVDFEKMQGIEGIALANQVINTKEVNAGNPKKLKTMITFDDGASWRSLTRPELDPSGKPYDCKDCSLNLHSYSERRNPRDLFSHSSAVGLMVGVGNVGTSLTSYTDGDTFLTRDAGKTWKAVHDQAHLWEFGDQGALLLIVNDEEATDQVVYTADEGLNWNRYTFVKNGDKKVRVSDIITQPDGTSQKFVLLGKEEWPSGKQVAYHIDFSGLHMVKCKLTPDDPNNDDFEDWNPQDTRGEACLFGRQTQYYRRIPGKDCYIGEKILNLRKDIRNCSCASEDYECDYNYYRNEENKCVLYPGAQPLQPTCENGQDYFWEPTGYRKKPLSSCEGGNELDKKEKAYCEGKGSSGSGKWALYLGLPFGAAGILFGLFYYRKQARFGRIRLPDTSNYTTNTPPILKNILAVLTEIPYFLASIFSTIWILIRRLRMPSFPSNWFRGVRYSQLNQDDYPDTNLQMDE